MESIFNLYKKKKKKIQRLAKKERVFFYQIEKTGFSSFGSVDESQPLKKKKKKKIIGI